jgi:phage/plasmid-associated DNA primase
MDRTEDTDMDIAERMIQMINQERVMDTNYWLDIGKALYNCEEDEGGDYRMSKGSRAFSVWVSFSKNGSRTIDDCENEWESFEVKNSLTVKTLAWFARKDSPSMYNAWHRERYEKYMKEALSLLDDDIAKALYWVYWLDFNCKITEKKATWYQFKRNRWIPIPKGIELSKKISNEFYNKYLTMNINLLKESKSTTIKKVHDDNIDHSNQINKLYKKLKEKSGKHNIMSLAQEYFMDDKFGEFENANQSLMGLPNGVIECLDDKAIFRDGKPEDYITMTGSSKYHSEYNWDTPVVKDFMYWMKQTFTDKDMRHYFLKWCASLIHSYNVDKIIPCWTGEGHNSKSMVEKLLDSVFGHYSFTLSTEILTKRGAARENQQKALSSKKKYVKVQEPDQDTTFKNGILKEWSGMDSFYANLLYDDGDVMEAMFKLFIVANKIPIIPGADHAIIERLRAFPFTSVWKKIRSEVPKSEEEQFKKRTFLMDKNFSNKIARLANGALWVFVQYYKNYRDEGLVEPKLVRDATEAYWEENDIYRHFIRDNIEVAVDEQLKSKENPIGINKNEKISITEMYKVFSPWFRESYPSLKLIDQPTMRSILKQRLKNLLGDEWLGYRFKFDPNDMMGGMTYSSYKK